MRYDDPQRPTYDEGASSYPLHLSGAPMPSIYLVRPMELEGELNERGVREWSWGWLVSIHAARGRNSFSHFYGTIRDLGKFQQEFLEDPEAALERYFKWKGPDMEEIKAKANGVPQNRGTIADDIFA